MLLRRHRAAGGCAADRATHTCPLSKRKWLWRDVSGDACRPSIGACTRGETCAEAGSRGFYKLPLINDRTANGFIWSYVSLRPVPRVGVVSYILFASTRVRGPRTAGRSRRRGAVRGAREGSRVGSRRRVYGQLCDLALPVRQRLPERLHTASSQAARTGAGAGKDAGAGAGATA